MSRAAVSALAELVGLTWPSCLLYCVVWASYNGSMADARSAGGKRRRSIAGDDGKAWKLVQVAAEPTEQAERMILATQTEALEEVVSFFCEHREKILEYRSFIVRDGLAELTATAEQDPDWFEPKVLRIQQIPKGWLWSWLATFLPNRLTTIRIEALERADKGACRKLFEFSTGYNDQIKMPKEMLEKVIATKVLNYRAEEMGQRLTEAWFDAAYDSTTHLLDFSKAGVYRFQDASGGKFTTAFHPALAQPFAFDAGLVILETTQIQCNYSDMQAHVRLGSAKIKLSEIVPTQGWIWSALKHAQFKRVSEAADRFIKERNEARTRQVLEAEAAASGGGGGAAGLQALVQGVDRDRRRAARAPQGAPRVADTAPPPAADPE
eukprot:TRINITY_DN31320_c0_g1_i4.p1 TRINITY_DN31320_c0_g1~~TRINITY_DN31320_c0_g1_i4.p1  ORF type:complete len:380 (+),score=96.94 TRINITY_DN31320_c0_g1_i4:472-1611(+)